MDGTGTSLIDPNLKTLQIGRALPRPHHDDDYAAINPCKPNEWRALGECIGDHQNLLNLIFCFGDIVVAGNDLKGLFAGASRNKSVREIKFFRCNSDRGRWGSALGNLAAFFENNHKLFSLAVWQCRLDQDATRSLAEALGASPACSLKIINWQRTRMAHEHEDWARLVGSLVGLRKLRWLDIRESFGPEGCKEVAGMLRHPCCVLKKISLVGNRIEDVGLAALKSAIAENKTLTGVCLNSLGGISYSSWRSFISILRHHRCRIKLICFNRNAIGEDKLAALGHAITANNTLRMLCLIGMGEISPAGWRSFSSILTNNHSLRTVLLMDNSIDDYAMEAFADAVKGNQRLEKLWLNGNHNITDRGWTFMRKALCDESSADSVYDSNHVLHQLYGTNTPHIIPELPDCLKYLRLNEGNINEARREKILLHFLTGNHSMEPISRMKSNIFPHLLSWIGGGVSRQCNEAMFNVLRKVPSLFGNSSRVSRRSKRKRRAGI